jgi:hypothetical protein
VASSPPTCPRHGTPRIRQTPKSLYRCLACEREEYERGTPCRAHAPARLLTTSGRRVCLRCGTDVEGEQ